MSNQAIIEVRHENDDVLVLIEDNYGKTFQSYEPEEFSKRFPTVQDLLREVSGEDVMDGCFYVDIEDNHVALEACSSVEVHDFVQGEFIQFCSGDEHGTVGMLDDPRVVWAHG